VITRDDCHPTIRSLPPTVSDHGLVIAELPLLHTVPIHALREVRGWRGLDRTRLAEALAAVPAFADPDSVKHLPVADLFDLYDSGVRQVIDHLLPTRPVIVRHRPLTPWFNSECHALRRQVRRAERVYRRSHSPDDRARWIRQTRDMHARFRAIEAQYWEGRIAADAADPRRLWSAFRGMLGGSADDVAPPPSFSADEFADHYEAKIEDIRRATSTAPDPDYSITACRLEELSAVTAPQLRHLITSSPSNFFYYYFRLKTRVTDRTLLQYKFYKRNTANWL